MKKSLIISLLISLGVGLLSSLITGGCMDIYKYLVKPSFAPPSIIFPIVWTILYIFMGFSAYLIFNSNSNKKSNALTIYGIQLVLNFIWPILFFLLNYRLVSFIVIITLLITIVIMIIKFYRINRLSAYLQIPYLLWVIFASSLNYEFYILNR